MSRSRRVFGLDGLIPALAGLMLILAACGGNDAVEPEIGSAPEPGAGGRQPRTEIAESLIDDMARQRHPSDGGGRAWLDPEPAPISASQAGAWSIIYEAGEHGIASGGMIYLQISPFWGWSTPQSERPEAAGYTAVSTSAEGVDLVPQTLDQQLLGIAVEGRGLRAGEQVRIVYGAGPAGATADRFAERESRFWIAVDGDGDGVRAVLADSPAVDVKPGPPARLLLTLPSTARPGETVRLTVAVLDARGNAGVPFDGTIQLTGVPDLATLRLRPEDGGRRTVELEVMAPGVLRLAATGPNGLEAESNPLQVARQGARVLWGDLQNHSGYSDGTALPEEHFLYARDVAGLDVYALTDHDHWGMLFLDGRPELWNEIRDLTRSFYEPGRFVTLLGYEWTSWIHGHRHVLFFGDDGPLLSSVDPAYDEPRELWDGLRGHRAMTVAHHSAGGPIATDWTVPPDPEIEPITEIVSVHGSSEAMDSPGVIHRPVPGNFVRDALDRGYRLGFVGSSDGHDGHPGLGHLASPSGGLAAILAEELTREAVYEALRARRVYATNGPRIILRVTFGGHRMGADVVVGEASEANLPGIGPDTLVARAIATAPLSHIDVVRSGEVIDAVDCGGERECAFGAALPDLVAGEYLYVRAVQRDGGAAWSSPFFFVDPPSEAVATRGAS